MEEFQILDFLSSEVLNSVFYNSYLNFGIPDFENSYFIILNLGISTFGILIRILKFWFKFWNSELGNSTQFREFRIFEILILEFQITKLNFKWSPTLCNFFLTLFTLIFFIFHTNLFTLTFYTCYKIWTAIRWEKGTEKQDYK